MKPAAATSEHAAAGTEYKPSTRRGSDAAAAPVEPALIVGSDSPSLPASMLRAGLECLAHADAVLGPAADGGYWCIGIRVPRHGLLATIPWSAADTFTATCARLEALGLSLAVLPAWTDVDVPDDLPVLARQIAACRAGGDPYTARHSERVLRSLGITVAVAAPAPPDAI